VKEYQTWCSCVCALWCACPLSAPWWQRNFPDELHIPAVVCSCCGYECPFVGWASGLGWGCVCSKWVLETVWLGVYVCVWRAQLGGSAVCPCWLHLASVLIVSLQVCNCNHHGFAKQLLIAIDQLATISRIFSRELLRVQYLAACNAQRHRQGL
jgi:hypothetical protein